jgi:hypothetical protein
MGHWVLVVVVSVLLSGSLALAKNKTKKQDGKSPGWEEGEKKGRKDTTPPGIEKKEEHLPPGLEKKEQAKGKKDEPPGWSQGKKEGWKGADAPPGLEKKDAQLPPGLTKNPPAGKKGSKAEKTTPPAAEKGKKGQKQ